MCACWQLKNLVVYRWLHIHPWPLDNMDNSLHNWICQSALQSKKNLLRLKLKSDPDLGDHSHHGTFEGLQYGRYIWGSTN